MIAKNKSRPHVFLGSEEAICLIAQPVKTLLLTLGKYSEKD